MNNNNHYLRLYDEKLDLLYEIDTSSPKYKSDQVTDLLRRSQMFLDIEKLTCYRLVPELK